MTLLRDDAALEALAPEWDALWQATASATPFQSPRWLLPWWHCFGTGMPRVATERQAGRLIGVMPLYILPDERKALPIGAGTTDYLDALGDPTGLLSEALDGLSNDEVDHCDLIDVPPSSRLPEVATPGWTASWTEGAACPVLTLPHIPGGIRRKLRMNRNRVERAGGCTVETAGPTSLPEFLADLIRLHQARWIAHGEPGVLSDPLVLMFLREAAPTLLDGGLLRLQRLRIAGQTAAVIAALVSPGRIFFYLSGYDEAQAFVSPGTLLLGAMLEQAIDEGRTEANFLRGGESYKYAWGGVDRHSRNGRLSRR